MVFDSDVLERIYARTPGRVKVARRIVGRPLTLTEKILYAHFHRPPKKASLRGTSYEEFSPDRVAMQDATAQMALLQFMSAGIPRVAVPTTVHCDHLIQAQSGAREDLGQALGVVLGPSLDATGMELKPLLARVHADGPLVPPLTLAFARWISREYLAPPAATLRSMLPPGMLERLELVAEWLPVGWGSGEGSGGAV